MLKQRVITAIVLALIVVSTILLLDSFYVSILFALIMFISLFELFEDSGLILGEDAVAGVDADQRDADLDSRLAEIGGQLGVARELFELTAVSDEAAKLFHGKVELGGAGLEFDLHGASIDQFLGGGRKFGQGV